jgi:AcrR family transcriptional regulator
MSAAPGGATRRRGEALEEAILEATLAELSTVGLSRFTIEGVAHRARTGKASVYRRWESKEDLVVDALQRAFPPLDEAIDHGDLRADLLALLRQMIDVINGPAGCAMQTLMGELDRDREFVRTVHDRVVDPRKRAMLATLQRGAARGQVRPAAVEPLVAQVAPAMIVHKFLVDGPPVADEFVQRVVDDIVLPLVRP